jgi:hypothetical protein
MNRQQWQKTIGPKPLGATRQLAWPDTTACEKSNPLTKAGLADGAGVTSRHRQPCTTYYTPGRPPARHRICKHHLEEQVVHTNLPPVPQRNGRGGQHRSATKSDSHRPC